MNKFPEYCVYILLCADKTLYTGYTKNLSKRFKLHEEGKGAKYTRGRGPLALVYWEYFHFKSLAMTREHEIKKLTHKQKLELINKKYE